MRKIQYIQAITLEKAGGIKLLKSFNTENRTPTLKEYNDFIESLVKSGEIIQDKFVVLGLFALKRI